MNTKSVVAGMGEIGIPLFKLLSQKNLVVGYDIDKKLMNKFQFKKYEQLDTDFLHVCIPFSKNFFPNILDLVNLFDPSCVIIHSTVSPYTTKKLQKKLKIPVIYSAIRGVHRRMLQDLKKYTKFFAIENDAPKSRWASTAYSVMMKKCGVRTKKISKPITLELAKIICDTSYYGWLINYAQLSNMLAIKHGVNYDEMWSFADEIHKFLGNRPKMYPGFIGGHCIIPNLDLISNKTLDLIKEINLDYSKILSKRTKKGKKY